MTRQIDTRYCKEHRLAELLKDRGAKQRLAKKIGKNAGIISHLCSGRHGISSAMIVLITDALGIPVWQLFSSPQEVLDWIKANKKGKK